MSDPLKAAILDEIDRDGPMTFARFIELALYDPDHGYYAQPATRAGAEWFTGPTLHPVFGWTIARGLAPYLERTDEPWLVEVGAGSGELTRDILYGLDRHAPTVLEAVHVAVVERSEEALERARITLTEAGIDLADVTFESELPKAVRGCIVSNELLDAMPVHLVERRVDGVAEFHVANVGGELQFEAREPSSADVHELADRVLADAPEGTQAEVPLAALTWVRDAAERLEAGALVTIDYGDSSAALRKAFPRGTVHAYADGLRREEVLANPGRMDLTYRVPMDLVREAGETVGLRTDRSSVQAEALTDWGIHRLADELEPLDRMAVKKLIDVDGAGGSFQVLVQTR